MKKIAVLTSGGDAPAMNACIRSIVQMGEHYGYEVDGIIGGYQGLIDGKIKHLSHKDIENIIQLGGTILKTSRCVDFLTNEGFNNAVNFIKASGYEAVVVLGGDGSLKGALKLSESGIKVVGIPCTIDNDISHTDFTIGFDTAINTVTSLLYNIRETSSSHERVCVVEVMGRHSGQIALNAGTASGAEVVLVPELKVPINELMQKIKKSVESGEKCVLVVVAEGVCTAEEFAKEIKLNLKIDAKSVDLSYVQRGGSPSAFDRILATKFGAMAVKLIKNKKTGVFVASLGGELKSIKLKNIEESKPKFDFKLYEVNDKISV